MKLRFLISSCGVFPWILGLLALHGCSSLPGEPLDRRLDAQADDQMIETVSAVRLRDEVKYGNRLVVTSYNRYALLTGEVPDSATRARIANTVIGIENVQGVWNELTIADTNSIPVKVDDTLVTSRVRARLAKDAPLVAKHVKVVVDAGTVFLLGIVSAQEAREAIQIARATEGARYVVNVLQVVSDAEIQRIEIASKPPPPVANDCSCAAPVQTKPAPLIRGTW
ncbi:MAG: BON domain-containing protein [Zoogloeaceae bacterium]|jgi:osmotically-inducible protein OsmY|nr:BON domain-containing protein [Zoogloeaceae bacterium]